MGKLQPRSEFRVSKALKIPGSGGEAISTSAKEQFGFEAYAELYPSNHAMMSSGLERRRAAHIDRNVPSWCYPAFQFEKAQNKSERTDWEFVVPVWIAITLFCSLVQVVGFQTLASLI